LIPRLALDTKALSGATESNPAVLEILTGVGSLAPPVVVLGEYRFGIAQLRHKIEYTEWLERLMQRSAVLDITNQTAAHYSLLRLELKQTGKPIPTNDAWIAALCREHGLPLLSRDRHFDLVGGVRRIDW
jgi:predicted nucleic acid-binding protein